MPADQPTPGAGLPALKPCPHCKATNAASIGIDALSYYFVGCDHCDAYTGRARTEAEAAADWNGGFVHEGNRVAIAADLDRRANRGQGEAPSWEQHVSGAVFDQAFQESRASAQPAAASDLQCLLSAERSASNEWMRRANQAESKVEYLSEELAKLSAHPAAGEAGAVMRKHVANLLEIVDQVRNADLLAIGMHAVPTVHEDIEAARAALSAPTPQAAGTWITCAERMPEPEDNVLWCRCPVVEPYLVACMLDEDYEAATVFGSFTHWQPLPEPPSNEKPHPAASPEGERS